MIKVKRELQTKVESFLQTWPSVEEYGGFFFVNRLGNVCEFLPIPNIHSSKRDTYLMPDSAKALAEKYASMKKLKMFAQWHNHPTPAVCSVQDCRAAQFYDPLYSVMISPTDKYKKGGRKEFVWYFYKGIKPEPVGFI